MVRIIVAMALFASLLASPSAAGAQDQWKEEFKRLCSYTDISDTLTDEELDTLIKDSDVLIEKLEALDVPEAKVYIFRLKKCRNMYRFIIDIRASRKKGAKAAPAHKFGRPLLSGDFSVKDYCRPKNPKCSECPLESI